jgi:hypothetical protein
MGFARWVFLVAGIQGLLSWSTGYLAEPMQGVVKSPPIGRPEYFYGFLGAVLAWQLSFLLIARDPTRYRPLMLVATLQKFSFFAPCIGLFAVGRLADRGMLVSGMIDGVWMVLFAIAWTRSRATPAPT